MRRVANLVLAMGRGSFACLLSLVLLGCSRAPGEPAGAQLPADLRVLSVSLLHAASGTAVANADPIAEGSALELASLPAAFSLRANLAGGSVGSVRFAVDDGSDYHTADVVPFTLVAASTLPWSAQAGPHSLRVTPYSRPGASGQAGPTLTLHFSLSQAPTPPPPPPPPAPDRHFLYSVIDNAVLVYDIDDGHKLLRRMHVAGEYEMYGIRGVAADAASSRLYVSYRGSRYLQGEGQLLALDLVSGSVVWHKAAVRPSVDSLAVTPDGSKLYVATGEERSDADWFLVLDARDGRELGRITVHPNTHNTLVSLDGKSVYFSSVSDPYLTVADTASDQVRMRVGPFSQPVRPFVVNSSARLAFANVEMLIGFEVADLASGAVLYRVEASGDDLHRDFPPPPEGLPPSHGIALTPDEREVWVADFYNSRVHVFDASGLPALKPTQVASILLPSPPKWISFSRDGRYAYVAAADEGNGFVIDAAKRTLLGTMQRSRHGLLEVDFDASGENPKRAYSRYGVGYRDAP